MELLSKIKIDFTLDWVERFLIFMKTELLNFGQIIENSEQTLISVKFRLPGKTANSQLFWGKNLPKNEKVSWCKEKIEIFFK